MEIIVLIGVIAMFLAGVGVGHVFGWQAGYAAALRATNEQDPRHVITASDLRPVPIVKENANPHGLGIA